MLAARARKLGGRVWMFLPTHHVRSQTDNGLLAQTTNEPVTEDGQDISCILVICEQRSRRVLFTAPRRKRSIYIFIYTSSIYIICIDCNTHTQSLTTMNNYLASGALIILRHEHIQSVSLSCRVFSRPGVGARDR